MSRVVDTGVVDIDGRPIFEGDEVECIQWEGNAHAWHVFNGGKVVYEYHEYRVGATGVPLHEYKMPEYGCEVRLA